MHPHLSRASRSAALGRRARVLGLAACWWLGCGGGTAQPTPLAAAPSARSQGGSSQAERPRPGTVEVHAEADPVETSCAGGARETCDAIDDDCDGTIDEGCGYRGGGVQITVSWDSGADLDLYVTDPSGATLYYNEQHDRTELGGHLDHNARGDCRREQQNPRVENAFWPSPPPAGSYRVELHYFSPCEKATVTEAQLSLAVRQQVLGTYRFRLSPEQKLEALSFDVY